MSAQKSWFRPLLDNPGALPGWELDQSEAARVTETLQAAADAASARLHRLFGTIGDTFGAEALTRSLAAAPFDADRALALAKAVTALDYHCYRATPRRLHPGGLSNKANRKVWERLRPHLFERLLAVIASDAWQSLVWRAVFARVPETWLPATLIEKSLEETLVRLGPYKSLEVELALEDREAGGLRWIRQHVEEALGAMNQSLRQRRPVLIELIRSTESSPIDSQALIVFRADSAQSDEQHLFCYDPADAGNVVRIDVQSTDTGWHISDRHPDTDRASVKALRVFLIEPIKPPLFGVRRYLDRVLPWKLCWSLKRRVLLLFARYRDVAVEDLAAG